MSGIDLQQCEHCNKQFPIEMMTSMEDCWFCQGCVEEWRKEFDACAHDWSPHVSTMGEEGRICSRCNGFVAGEDTDLIGV